MQNEHSTPEAGHAEWVLIRQGPAMQSEHNTPGVGYRQSEHNTPGAGFAKWAQYASDFPSDQHTSNTT